MNEHTEPHTVLYCVPCRSQRCKIPDVEPHTEPKRCTE